MQLPGSRGECAGRRTCAWPTRANTGHQHAAVVPLDPAASNGAGSPWRDMKKEQRREEGGGGREIEKCECECQACTKYANKECIAWKVLHLLLKILDHDEKFLSSSGRIRLVVSTLQRVGLRCLHKALILPIQVIELGL